MFGMHACVLHIWKSLGMVMVIGWLLVGCTKAPKVPTPTEAEISQKITALADCTARTQRVVDAAMSAGASAGEMGPTNTGIADARETLDEARQLLQGGKLKDANERVSQALDDCQKLEAQAAQARDAALARQAQARARAQAEQRIQQVMPCIEAARQAIQSAEAAGTTQEDLASAKRALANSEAGLREAQQLLAQGDAVRALSRLDAAQSDCLSARDQANQAGIAAAQRRPSSYTVVRGDSLWRISGRPVIYSNPFMWPLIYKANRDKIKDPDLIYPRQVFAIPRTYAKEEADTAIRRARTRGPWRIGDGPDYYVLEGARRR
jgi:nucleoid-associated protein YgaU